MSLARTTHEFQHFKKVRKRDIPFVFFDRMLDGYDVNAMVITSCCSPSFVGENRRSAG